MCCPLRIVVFSLEAPNSAHQYFIMARKNKLSEIIGGYLPSSGTLRALATSSKLKMLVLTPFSLLSCFNIIFGILYLRAKVVSTSIVGLPVAWVLNVGWYVNFASGHLYIVYGV